MNQNIFGVFETHLGLGYRWSYFWNAEFEIQHMTQ